MIGIPSEDAKSADANATGNLESSWGFEIELTVCPYCDWNYLLQKGSLPQQCPHCHRESLISIQDSIEELPYLGSPELALSFGLSGDVLARGIIDFSRGIPYPPLELVPDVLVSRLKQIYIPVWLVDAEVQSNWKAEAGFNYQVISHQDQYSEHRGGWASHEVTEGRIRWEPRAGCLNRSYENISAPALEDAQRLNRLLGVYDLSQAHPYLPEVADQTFVRLPTRVIEDAWTDALPAFQSAASRDCQEAAGADHLKDFEWKPEFAKQHWSLLLQPVYSTFYIDDEGGIQPVLINGQSGKVSGTRRSSVKRAQRTAWIILFVAIITFAISLIVTVLGIVAPLLLPIGGIGLAISVFIGAGAVLPLTVAWQFNRSQRSDPEN